VRLGFVCQKKFWYSTALNNGINKKDIEMAGNSKIEWTTMSWNPLVGCRKVSAGCKNCYAELMSNRQAGMGRAALARGEDPGKRKHYLEVIRNGCFNGTVSLVESALDEPYGFRDPALIFVNSMADLLSLRWVLNPRLQATPLGSTLVFAG